MENITLPGSLYGLWEGGAGRGTVGVEENLEHNKAKLIQTHLSQAFRVLYGAVERGGGGGCINIFCAFGFGDIVVEILEV